MNKKLTKDVIEHYSEKICDIRTTIDSELYDLRCIEEELEKYTEVYLEEEDFKVALKLILKELTFDINNGKLAKEIAEEALGKAGEL